MNEPSEVYWLFRPFANAARAWNDFWFRPGDPLTLGFIRVCTGLVFVYILLCSGPLLSSFYAPDAWVDGQAADVLRKTVPWTPPEPGWEDAPPLWFGELDRNGDGVVTRKEWLAVRNWPRSEVEFDYVDGDKDGKITLEEANRSQFTRQLWVRPDAVDDPLKDEVNKEWNTYPAYTLDVGQPFFSHFYHLTTPWQRDVAHVLALVVVVLFTLGVGTRVTSVLAWVVGLCYIHRIPVSLFGMDVMLGILLLYLMVGQCGGALSFDRLLLNWRRDRQGLEPLGRQPSASATLALRLIQVHFCVIYFMSGASKLQGNAWWNGTSIWRILATFEFIPKSAAFTSFLQLLTMNRPVWEIANTASAWGTIALEVSLPFLIWDRRFRWVMICGSVCMHTFIAATMGLTAFSMLMICMVFTFVPPQALEATLAAGRRWLARLPRRATARQQEPARETAGV